MKITLTLDNGPDVEATPLVLDTLRQREVSAIFFVVGEKLRHARSQAERAWSEGHWIGNHSFNHLGPLGLCGEPGQARAEIERTQALIGDMSHERRFFRPVGGGGGGQLDRTLLNAEAADLLREGGFSCVTWNAVPRDWIYPTGWVNVALEQCRAQEHSVLVLHDLPTGAMAHLDRFIGVAKDEGAEFVQSVPPECLLMDRGVPSDRLKEIAS